MNHGRQAPSFHSPLIREQSTRNLMHLRPCKNSSIRKTTGITGSINKMKVREAEGILAELPKLNGLAEVMEATKSIAATKKASWRNIGNNKDLERWKASSQIGLPICSEDYWYVEMAVSTFSKDFSPKEGTKKKWVCFIKQKVQLPFNDIMLDVIAMLQAKASKFLN